MDTRLLQAFIVLAESRSYRNAAQQLFITQPALTKQIQALEHEMGLKLFTRGRRGAQLTHAGELLLDKAKSIVLETTDLHQMATEMVAGKTGRLAVGFGISGFYDVPKLVAKFNQHYPKISISLEDMPSSEQTRLLLEGQLQLSFMRMPVEPPLIGINLRTESLALAVSTQSEATLIKQLSPSHCYSLLSKLPLLALHDNRGPGLNRQIARFLAFNQIEPHIQQTSGDIQTLMALVAAGIGMAIVPLSTANISPASIGLIPLEGPYAAWEVGMIWNPALDDPLRDLFIALVRKEAAEQT